MASTTMLPGPGRSSSTTSHSSKPGRRRGSLRIMAFGLCLVFFSLMGQAQAAALHRGRIDQILRAIVARQDPLSGSSPSSTSPPTTTAPSHTKSSIIQRPKTQTSSSKSASPSNGTNTATSAEPQLTGLPKAFDSIIGNNFTNPACPKFLEGLSANPSFNNCLPLSIIMQSESFFEDSMSKSLLNDVLDATCNVDLTSCQTLMQNLAQQLRTNENCQGDYDLGNPVVLDAYYGFISYTPLYRAGCLKASPSSATSATDSSSSDPEYCYASATTNGTGALNGYIYSLPLGSPLPSSGNVNCSTCLQQTMGFFADAASNATSPMSSLYNSAAQEINAQCGSSWVKTNVAVNKSTENSGTAVLRSPMSLLILIAAGAGLFMM